MKLYHRIIAALVLMAYAITGTSLMPVAVVMLAALDGSHDVVIRQSEQGTQLVLHHRVHEFTPQLTDHRKCMARVLVSLCRPNQEGDHQLVSAHVTSTACLDVMPSISPPVALNAEATLALKFSLECPVRDMIRAPMTTKEFWISHQPPLLSTIQLLI